MIRGGNLYDLKEILGHSDMKMTMRYAAVMPETLRREFDQAFAAIDDEHRITAQVHVVLSPLEEFESLRDELPVELRCICLSIR